MTVSVSLQRRVWAAATCMLMLLALLVAGAAHTTKAHAVTRPNVSKVLVFMVENHSLTQMRTSMPFTRSLLRRYAYASDYVAIRHPSLPNYLAIAGGSTFGVADDAGPGAHPLHGPSIFDQAIVRHRTAKIYADSAPTNCAMANAGNYAVRHNPWTYFVDQRANCRRFDVPVTRLAADAASGRLPNIAMVIPNLVHDAHNASLAASDAWIKTQVTRLQAGPDWKAGRLAIVITADEDDFHSGNRVLTVVASRYQSHLVAARYLNHYSLTRLFSDVMGTPYLRQAATAPSMKTAFGMKTAPRP